MDKQSFEINRLRWNEMSNLHFKSDYYNVNSFKQGETSLFGTELRELSVLKEKSILHLMCHFGLDSLSLARLGAHVTGVDLSDEMIAKAKILSQEHNIPANFYVGNVYDIPNLITETFDIVYMSYGVLCWLPDLDKLMEIVSARLKPGGFFYIAEIHPVGLTIDPDYSEGFKAADPYFSDGLTIEIDDDSTYVDNEEKIEHTKSIEWTHTMGEFLNSVIKSGLKLDFFHEFPYAVFQMHPDMFRGEDKHWYFNDPKKFSMPCTFSLKASK